MVHTAALNNGLYKLKNMRLRVAVFGFAAFVTTVGLYHGVGFATPGTTCDVPTLAHATIQSAVDDPTCMTVKVAPGNYTESVVVARTVTLKGAKAGVSINSRSSGTGESKVTGVTDAVFTVQVPNVTIDGFTIANPGKGFGILVKTDGDDAVVKNNIVNDIGSAALTFNPAGIYLEYGPDGVNVVGNKVTNVLSNVTAQGIYVGDSTSADPSVDTLIKRNVISNVTSTTKGAYGIQLNNGSRPAPANGYTEARIIDNNIKDLSGKWAHGIGLEGPTPNAVVSYNTISNLINTVTGTVDKVAVKFEDNPFFFTADVNRNSLAVGDAAYGIQVASELTSDYPSLSVNGECNWWGAADGPGPVGTGHGSLVTTGVDYKPWLKSSNLDGRCGEKSHGHDDGDHHYGRDNDWWDKKD